MFDNIGRKLKTISLVFCIIGITLSIIGGIILMIENFLLGLSVALFGSFFSWLSTISLYGIGEAAENSSKILNILQNNSIVPREEKEEIEEKKEMVLKRVKVSNPDQIEKLNEYGINFIPTITFKNIFSTATSLRSENQIVSCLESALEILKDSDEKQFVSNLLSLPVSEIKKVVLSINDLLSNQ